MFDRAGVLGAAMTLCASLLLAIPVVAQDAAPAGTTQAVASRTPDGIRVRYRLPAPVTTFTFADRDTIRTLWSVTTPGLVLADGAVSSDQPFDTFELALKPDAAEVDRIYPGLSRIGQGRVIYGPGLKAATGETSLEFALAPGEAFLPQTDAIDGYAYVGPASGIVADPRGDVATGDNVDADLVSQLNPAFFRSMAFYEARLDAPLPYRPALLVSVDSPGPATFRGDVTDTGAISLRFQGEAWRGAEDALTTFIWHETFHLWNGHGVVSRDGDTAPWLHEGGANLAALIGAVSTGGLTEPQARDVLTGYLNGCRRTLGDNDLRPTTLRSGSGPYTCGALIQWIADLELRRAEAGDAFTLWKVMLDAARTHPENGYGVTDFRAALVPDSAVAILLDGPGASRWMTIRSRLTALGVRIENRPGDKDLQGAALFHIAQRNCKTGSYGFFDTPGALKLDGADCGVLSGEPIIDTVEGFNPQTESRAMFDAVQARCAASLPVRYATRDGRTLEAVCDAPLETPEIWAVVEAPPLAISK